MNSSRSERTPALPRPASTTNPGRTTQRVPAEDGFWVLIFGDLTVFTAFFGTYLYYRGQHPMLFADAQRQLSQWFGLINTMLLLTSSLLVSIGVRAVRRSSPTIARLVFLGAILCAAGFVAVKGVEWGLKLAHGTTPTTNSFFMYYFILTGLHLFHVLIGIAGLVYLSVQGGRTNVSIRRFAFIEAGAVFWHMVDLLWIVLFALLYLVR